MQRSNKQGGPWVVLALAGGLALAGCSGDETEEPATAVEASTNTGSLGLNLTLSSGVTLDAFTATISGVGLAAPIIRTIPVPRSSATVSASFGGLPRGPYLLELEATSRGGESECRGSANFTVVAQQSVGVSVAITCRTDSIRAEVTLEAEPNVCPDVNSVLVAPRRTRVGSPISVEANAEDSDGDAISFAWTATSGSFAAPSSATTTYMCSDLGEQTLSVTINDEGNCASLHQTVVRCGPDAECGDGVLETDQGEECDPPDGFLCSASCQDIECGDGILAAPEECDGGPLCSPQCTLEDSDGCGLCTLNSCALEGLAAVTRCADGVCDTYVACRDATDCDDSGDSRVCYCGTGGFALGSQSYDDHMTACFAAASVGPTQAGACRAEIEILAGTNVPSEVDAGWSDADTPLGALNQLTDCWANSCADECL